MLALKRKIAKELEKNKGSFLRPADNLFSGVGYNDQFNADDGAIETNQ